MLIGRTGKAWLFPIRAIFVLVGASIIAALGFNQSFLVSYARDCRAKIFGREKWGVWELRLRLGLVSPDWQQNYAATCLARALINELVD